MKVTERLDDFAQALLMPINPTAVIILGLYTVVWGFWVANPFWTVFSQASIYSVLAALAPEVFWGTLAIFCGLITTYGAIRRSYPALIVGAQVAGWHWLMISTFYFIGDPFNTGGITALTFAIYAAYVYLNTRVNFKDDKHSEYLMHHE